MNTSTINQLISVVSRLVFGRYLYDSMQIVDSHVSNVQVQQELHLNKLTVCPMVSFDRLWSTPPFSWSVLGGEKSKSQMVRGVFGIAPSLWRVFLAVTFSVQEQHFCSHCFSLFWYFRICFHSNRERPLQSTAPWLQSWRVSEGCTSTTASAACPLHRPRTPQLP